jgi:hypothetical protein
MKKILVLHADIGAAKNITKNICLLDNTVHFPVSTKGLSKQDYLLKYLYPTDYNNWFSCEYRLKNYTEYGIEMDLGDPRSTGIIPLNHKLKKILEHNHFILDLMDHATAAELVKQDYVKLLAIAPTTMLGLNWQIRAYTMKYGAGEMFNFTFQNKDNIEKFKQAYGNETWIEVNLCNFYDKVRERRRILNRSGITVMPLELIIWPDRWSELIDYIEQFFELKIPRDQAFTVLNQWMSLHWDTQETNNWVYRGIFKEFRSTETKNKLALCEGFDNV